MQNKKRMTLVATVGILGATLLVANTVSAHGLFGRGSEQKVEATAEVLGLDAETLQTELETKDLHDILTEQGISQTDFRSQMQEQHRAALEEKGLSDAEIDEILAEMEKHHQAMLDAKAEILGMTAEELEAALEEQSFPELLDEKGVSHTELREQMRELRPDGEGKGFGSHHNRGFGKSLSR